MVLLASAVPELDAQGMQALEPVVDFQLLKPQGEHACPSAGAVKPARHLQLLRALDPALLLVNAGHGEQTPLPKPDL